MLVPGSAISATIRRFSDGAQSRRAVSALNVRADLGPDVVTDDSPRLIGEPSPQTIRPSPTRRPWPGAYALTAAGVLAVAAAAATGGILAPIRLAVAGLWTVDLGSPSWAKLNLAAELTGAASGLVFSLILCVVLATWIVSSVRFRRRRNLIVAGLGLGAAVTSGWIVTGPLAYPFGSHRLESLTFVAPLGRVLLLTIGATINEASFAVASVFGVLLGSCIVTWRRDELRWEAFDDAREMRLHMLGACLMGFGGVLARGCTIGQGLSAASTLALSAPIAILFMFLGARLGLFYLIEGRVFWGQLFSHREP